MSWENFYSEGVEVLGPTEVRRFRVDHPRDLDNFNRLSAELHPRRSNASLSDQEAWMRAQGPMSSDLLAYLREKAESYDAFLFFGYLYATTYFGLPLVRDRAWLEPLAHDEWTITLDTYAVSTGKTVMFFTRLRAPYVNPDRFRFTIYRRGLFSDIAKWLGMQDVVVGHEDFDRDFIIKGTGQVSAVKVNGSTSSAMANCMYGKMQSVSFPKFNGAKTHASFSLALK